MPSEVSWNFIEFLSVHKAQGKSLWVISHNNETTKTYVVPVTGKCSLKLRVNYVFIPLCSFPAILLLIIKKKKKPWHREQLSPTITSHWESSSCESCVQQLGPKLCLSAHSASALAEHVLLQGHMFRNWDGHCFATVEAFLTLRTHISVQGITGKTTHNSQSAQKNAQFSLDLIWLFAASSICIIWVATRSCKVQLWARLRWVGFKLPTPLNGSFAGTAIVQSSVID